METTLFEYELPKSAIAQVPVEKRDESRLLVINRQSGKIEDHRFHDLPGLLPKPCLLFRNNATSSKHVFMLGSLMAENLSASFFIQQVIPTYGGV